MRYINLLKKIFFQFFISFHLSFEIMTLAGEHDRFLAENIFSNEKHKKVLP